MSRAPGAAMALRLIEAYLDRGASTRVRKALAALPVLSLWHAELADGQALVRVLAGSGDTEAIVDALDKHFSTTPGYRLLVLPVEATLPRHDTDVPRPGHRDVVGRRSREELYAEVAAGARFSPVWVVLVVLSVVVAAVGLLRDNVGIVIAAMLMAPLLGPNVAFALATTLGDVSLARGALKASGIGLVLSVGLSVLAGAILPVDPDVHEIAVRTHVGLSDVVLGLASGSAAALSFTAGLPSTLVGVMVAVALLPPTVTLGLLAGAAHWSAAAGAALVLLTNVVCVNLASVGTFFVQGVRPTRWFEAERARRATRLVILVWLLLLGLLVAAILVAHRT